MQIQYAVSLWNFIHYANRPDFGEIAEVLRANELGIELWNSFENWSLNDKETRLNVKTLFAGLPVSYHTEIGGNSKEFHQNQINNAVEVGAQKLVLHSDNLYYQDTKELDVDLTGFVVESANTFGIDIMLENGQLPFLTHAIAQVPTMKICLDVGHVYLTNDPMSAFLEQLGPSVTHLHLQEILSPLERGLLGQSGIILDHYIPGTGGIPMEDWTLLFEYLQKRDYAGMAVFEIQPRKPLQTAVIGRDFVEKFILPSNYSD